MRVLVAADFIFPDDEGGGGRVAWEAARGLQALGHETRVWCLARRPGLQAEQRVEGMEVRRLHAGPGTGPLALPALLRGARASLGALLADFRPESVVSCAPLAGWLARRQPALSGLRCVHFYHSSWGEEYRVDRGRGPAAWPGAWARAWIERGLLRRASAVACLSEHVRQDALRRHGLPPERVVVVPAGVDAERFSPGDRAQARRELGISGGPVLLTVRNLRPRMGWELLFGAAVLLRRGRPGLVLLVAGAGPLERELRERAAALGLGGVVRFEGRVPESRLPAYYRAADLFLLPTRELEGFGLVLLEALACGTPCAATPVGGIPEVLGPLEPRWLAAAVSAEALARAADAALEDRRPRLALRDYALSRYDWERMARSLEVLLAR